MLADLNNLDPTVEYLAVFSAKVDLTAQWPGVVLYPGVQYKVRGDVLTANKASVQSANTIS